MGKAFEKQIKTIEGQGQKQVKTLKDLNSEEQTRPIVDKSDDELLLQKETYNRFIILKLNVFLQ